MTMSTFSGSIKWFEAEKGYGFIVPDENIPGVERELFVHYREIVGRERPCEGTRVEFEVGPGYGPHADRPQAVKVRISR